MSSGAVAGLPAPVEGVLDDGTRVLFRPLGPHDVEGLREGFSRLSPESRYRRFFYAIDHLSDEQLRYLTDIDYVNHFAWLALLTDESRLGIGVGRWIRTEDDPTSAEAAVTVIDEYQRRGVGGALLRLMAESAIERGIRSFRAQVLGGNQAMIDLLHSLGIGTESWKDGIDTIEVPLPATIADLEQTPAPRILRAAAAGEVIVSSGPGGFGTLLTQRGPGGEPDA
ncbi:MAG TPA: GNAT family N-acetyltransferase [Candidatus Dormibacteraeota bacterium]|jgi:GNAT superfamily N-acetyltransferase|nr:GNAT family N-acetyltransferase [Candidatus Dormibacteraeota bacterium]